VLRDICLLCDLSVVRAKMQYFSILNVAKKMICLYMSETFCTFARIFCIYEGGANRNRTYVHGYVAALCAHCHEKGWQIP
jgi:hypothetical protein